MHNFMLNSITFKKEDVQQSRYLISKMNPSLLPTFDRYMCLQKITQHISSHSKKS